MADLNIALKKNKKIYFASDLHLGLSAFSRTQETHREEKIVRWLDSIKNDAQAIFLVGDIFDFWYEYKHVVPKGFIRFLGKITELVDYGIPVYFFTGNHDLWMFRYLQSELNVVVFKKPIELRINESSFYIGHGDGLGPGDSVYKVLKKVFTNSFAQWIFKWIHPDIGMGLAKRWSRSSRIKKFENYDQFLGEKEFLTQYCKRKESEDHRDFYIFGHRHLALEIDINEKTKYYNLGEWVHEFSYGVFDGGSFQLIKFEDKS